MLHFKLSTTQLQGISFNTNYSYEGRRIYDINPMPNSTEHYTTIANEYAQIAQLAKRLTDYYQTHPNVILETAIIDVAKLFEVSFDCNVASINVNRKSKREIRISNTVCSITITQD